MPEAADIQVVESEEGEDSPELDASGNVIRIDHPDGSLTISLDGMPIQSTQRADRGWFDNLVEDIDQMELSRISEDLLRGIADDMASRRDWVEDRANGLKLLGLKIEIPGLNSGADGAPVEGMSRVRHPLLLEAVLRFQANARSELLPTDGPVKIRDDSNNPEQTRDRLADALENDFNHYLTSVATEYYPDTDRMLLMLGFGGSAFKKVYFCPLRNRPISESVDAEDLIVNNSATDLKNARRVTHRVTMRPSVVKRLQILGAYRDVDLNTPSPIQYDSAQREKMAQEGIAVVTGNPEDRDREIYECYCELDIKGFEHKWKGKETGLEIPYRVTIDVSSRQILSIVRNYSKGTDRLPEARSNFVEYVFIPGFGFYGIGLLHILGNTTNAVTAAWRELLDAGMYANFPGFLMSDAGARQNTNIFRVPPGGAALVKTSGMPIAQAVMPLPYKEPSQALMALVTNIAETGQRLGGTSEQAVGEGRADAPVGTTLALIEQAQKILNSVHKRMHAAQAEEFQLMKECFQEHPDSFWQRRGRKSYPWDEQTFLQALNDCELIPQADPNTASHTQRIMKVMALKQLQQSNPTMYDPIAIDKAALHAIGWNNPEQFLAPPTAQAKMPPEMQEKMAKLQIAKQDADSRAKVADAKVAETTAKMQGLATGGEINDDHGLGAAELQLKMRELDHKERATEAQLLNDAADAKNREEDRKSKTHLEHMKFEAQRERELAEREHEVAIQHREHLFEHAKHVLDTIARGNPTNER
jgi:hypothetical protein